MSVYDKPHLNITFRIKIASILVVVFFTILFLRLWYLQIVQGNYFRNLSENNRIRTVYVEAPRGIIYDRNGEILVTNRPAFNIELVTEDCPDVKGTIAKLEEFLKLEAGTIQKNTKFKKMRRPFEPRLLLRDVSREMVAEIAARKYDLPGVVIGVTPARNYIHKDLGAHALGYIREISKTQLEKPKYAGYRLGDYIGQFGIEKVHEEMLRGVRGLQRVEVNATGARIGEFSYESERMGNDLHLTIDINVQKAAEEALGDKKGAVVAMDPNTGEILALVSSPAFDPNIFTGQLSSEQWKDLSTGENAVLTNRVVQAAYPPGSVFKIITGLAGLNEGVISPNETVYCPGFYKFAGRKYRCHKHSGHGYVNLEQAIIQSCDVYFYALGQRLGVDTINHYATQFGLGDITGLSLAIESKGLVPSTEWKRKYFRKKEDQIWFPGETLSVAIGQGAVTVTPMQVARALAALVNGGYLVKPQLIKRVTGAKSRTVRELAPDRTGVIKLKPGVVSLMRKALTGVVNNTKGTGRRARLDLDPEVIVSGKTGTAQVVSLDYDGKHEKYQDHAWFAAYAPAEKPEIVVAVIVENSGHGGSVAAPISKELMTAFFKHDSQIAHNERKDKKAAG